jgi:phosphoribosylaminoimidazole-succinocarboxamide synthase
MSTTLRESTLPLPILRRGKVREVYEVDADRLLIVASDRVSAFDIVMDEAVPWKGQVLTQLSAFWFRQLAGVIQSHFISADTDEILSALPALLPFRDQVSGRAMLVARTEPVAFECVVRGYLTGSAWKEYATTGTLAGETLASGMRESERLVPPLFSPATKAESGHDENVPFAQMRHALGGSLADRLRDASLAIYVAGRDAAAERGLIVADTKFEFGLTRQKQPILIDEVLTPDSSRFWPSEAWVPGRTPPSFDKQPLRDWLNEERMAHRWNGESPGPRLPDEVIDATSRRYLEAYERLTGTPLPKEV